MLLGWTARLLYLGVAVECARQVRGGWSVRGMDKDAHAARFESARKEIASAHEQARLLLLSVLIVDALPSVFGLHRPSRYLPLVACGLAQLCAHAYATAVLRGMTWAQARAVARAYLRLTAPLGALAAALALTPAALAFLSCAGRFGPFGRDFALPALLAGGAALFGAVWTLHDVLKPLFSRGEDVTDEDLRRRHAESYADTGLSPARLRWLPETARKVDSLFEGIRAERLGMRPSLLLNRRCLEKLTPAETDLVFRYSAVLDVLGVNARPLLRYWAFWGGVFVPGLFLLRAAYASFAPDYAPFDFDLPAIAIFACAGFALNDYQDKRMRPLLADAHVLTRYGVEPAAIIALIGRLYVVHGHPLKGLDAVKTPELKSRLELLGRYVKREEEPARWLASVERRARALRAALAYGLAALLAVAAFGVLHAHRLPPP